MVERFFGFLNSKFYDLKYCYIQYIRDTVVYTDYSVVKIAMNFAQGLAIGLLLKMRQLKKAIIYILME